MSKLIEVRRNLNDGEVYKKQLVDDGLYVCDKCFHAYIETPCGNCHQHAPDKVDLHNQWSDEVYLYEPMTGETKPKPE